jgi:transcriptional regulator with XRE-family HTH domain
MPRRSGKHHDAILFGAILRRLRKARGWQINIAAQRCGMNANYLGSLEKGGNMPSVASLFTIAEVYGASAADIVREVEEARSAARKRRAEAVIAAETPAVR